MPSSTDADLREIRSLADRYAIAMDENDQAAFAELFLPEGALVVMAPGRDKPMGRFDGPGSTGVGLVAQLMADLYESTLHHVTTHEARVDGDGATGLTYCLAYHIIGGEDGGALETLGVKYEETFVRTDAGWRFHERRATRLWSQTTPTPRHPLLVDRAAGAARRG